MVMFDALLAEASARRASDVHLRVGQAPVLRVNGELVRVPSAPPITHEDLTALLASWLDTDQLAQLHRAQEVDLAWSVPGVGRCRASVFHERGQLAIALRLIPAHVPKLDEVGLPPAVSALAQESRGLVLVTGATGSGKSTTLAGLIAAINDSRAVHVLTIEDPIEFIHEDCRAVVTQREVGIDVPSYAAGLKSALRQDPDVIFLGELRDADTIATALLAAETGHLVLSTLHTLDAPETINRIVSVFPPDHQLQIRHQLARVLRASVSQRLLPRADGQGRVLAAEVLVSTAYVRDCIADPEKTGLLAGAIAAGAQEYGMQNFDQSIMALTRAEAVTVDEAVRWVTNVEEFKMRLRGITSGSASLRR